MTYTLERIFIEIEYHQHQTDKILHHPSFFKRLFGMRKARMHHEQARKAFWLLCNRTELFIPTEEGSKEVTPLTELVSEPIPHHGDLMTMEDFVQDCRDGRFVDYDGHGNYSDGENIYEHVPNIRPSDVLYGTVDERFSHVVWYWRI